MGNCNCGNTAGTGSRYQLRDAGGKVLGTYLSRTEAIAAMSVQPGSKVISTT